MKPISEDERPPWFATWRRLYLAVILYLGLLILLFYTFTRVYQFPS